MASIVDNFKSPIFIADFVLSIVLLALMLFCMRKLLQKKLLMLFFIAGIAGYVCAYMFGLSSLSLLIWTIMAIAFVLVCFVNIGDIRPLLINPMKNKKARTVNSYDKEAFFKVICDAVNNLSRSRTGALITFERRMSLSDYYKSGTMVNAPVSAEILETIFYEGTRLHDGAVIIKDNIIVCASVYYTPTTRALTGKYGARHRAALGISEVTDSLTVIVSEETGRVSLAYKGILEPVKLDEFPSIFRNSLLGND